jgi:hypothetical protein
LLFDNNVSAPLSVPPAIVSGDVPADDEVSPLAQITGEIITPSVTVAAPDLRI